MRDTSAKDCLHLFDTSVGGRLDPGWRAGVLNQRTKTIKAGPMIYVESFPVWDTRRRRAACSEAKMERHRLAQQRLNEKNAKKKLERLVNTNFVAGDLIVTCEYGHGQEPEDEKHAQRDIVAYLRRIAYMRKKRGLPVMRYIYITEKTSSAKYGVRYHHHVIMSGGITQADAQEIWAKKHAGICNAKIAQPTGKHLSGFARYLMLDKTGRTLEKDGKNPQQRAMRRRWNPSKNLVDPLETVADKKVSIRKAGRIAEAVSDFDQAKEIFEKLYPDCELLEVTAKRSPWTTGVYICAELRRRTSQKRKPAGEMPIRRRE